MSGLQLSGLVDIHCHILPGLDDGPGSLDESLEMARVAALQGVRVIVATPHIMTGAYEALPEDIARRVRDLQDRCEADGINVKILAGAEVYLDETTPELAKAGRLVTLGDVGRHLLVELPQQEVPAYVLDVLFRISLAGLKPVLAHPERNARLRADERLLDQIVSGGVLLQLNAGSVLGAYGSRVEACARKWLRRGVYSLVGSDWHSPQDRNALVDLAATTDEAVLALLRSNEGVCGNHARLKETTGL